MTQADLLLDSFALLFRRDLMRRGGYVDDYAGVRISAAGKRFRIEQAIVLNFTDAAGSHRGQAATFSAWTPLDVDRQAGRDPRLPRQ
jgi:hypothetical protein